MSNKHAQATQAQVGMKEKKKTINPLVFSSIKRNLPFSISKQQYPESSSPRKVFPGTNPNQKVCAAK